MTFNVTTTSGNTNNNSRDDGWKAQGFLNLYLPNKAGGRTKLGFIPLKASKQNERQLIEWLTEDPSRVQDILAQLQMDFQTAQASDDTGFALGS